MLRGELGFRGMAVLHRDHDGIQLLRHHARRGVIDVDVGNHPAAAVKINDDRQAGSTRCAHRHIDPRILHGVAAVRHILGGYGGAGRNRHAEPPHHHMRAIGGGRLDARHDRGERLDRFRTKRHHRIQNRLHVGRRLRRHRAGGSRRRPGGAELGDIADCAKALDPLNSNASPNADKYFMGFPCLLNRAGDTTQQDCEQRRHTGGVGVAHPTQPIIRERSDSSHKPFRQ